MCGPLPRPLSSGGGFHDWYEDLDYPNIYLYLNNLITNSDPFTQTPLVFTGGAGDEPDDPGAVNGKAEEEVKAWGIQRQSGCVWGRVPIKTVCLSVVALSAL